MASENAHNYCPHDTDQHASRANEKGNEEKENTYAIEQLISYSRTPKFRGNGRENIMKNYRDNKTQDWWEEKV